MYVFQEMLLLILLGLFVVVRSIFFQKKYTLKNDLFRVYALACHNVDNMYTMHRWMKGNMDRS